MHVCIYYHVLSRTHVSSEPLNVYEWFVAQQELRHHRSLAHVPHDAGGTGVNRGQPQGVGGSQSVVLPVVCPTDLTGRKEGQRERKREASMSPLVRGEAAYTEFVYESVPACRH